VSDKVFTLPLAPGSSRMLEEIPFWSQVFTFLRSGKTRASWPVIVGARIVDHECTEEALIRLDQPPVIGPPVS